MAEPIDAPCRLLKLPAELRNHIYDLVLEDTAPIEVDIFKSKKHMPSFALISTCRQIRQESLLLQKNALLQFWRSHQFFVKLDASQIHRRAYRSYIVRYCATLPCPRIRHLELRGSGGGDTDHQTYEALGAGKVRVTLRNISHAIATDVIKHARDPESVDVRKVVHMGLRYFRGVQVVLFSNVDTVVRAVGPSSLEPQ